MSHLLPIFHGLYGENNVAYLPRLYLTRGQPATLAETQAGNVPQALPLYIPPLDQPCPVRPRHATPPSPTKVDDSSTLFEDNVNDEA
jgi:hypothetical protein